MFNDWYDFDFSGYDMIWCCSEIVFVKGDIISNVNGLNELFYRNF